MRESLARRRRLGLAIGVLSLAAIVHGSEPSRISPGSERLSAAALRPFLARYAVFQDGEGGEREGRGHWDLQLREARQSGIPVWRMTWALHSASDTLYDDLVFEQASYRPLSRRIRAPGTDYLMLFDGGALRVTELAHAAEGPHATQRHALDGDRFAGAGELALAVLGLPEGAHVQLASIATDPPAFGLALLLDARVLGSETVRAAGRRRFETRKVETQWLTAEGEPLGMPAMTVWLAAEPPYVIRRTSGPRTWELQSLLEEPESAAP